MPYMLLLKDGAVAQEYELTDFPVTIGRQPGCAIVIDDARVSRRHAQIEKTKNGLMLTDLQSTHLTLVNQRPIDAHLLAHGDHVCLGNKVDLIFLASRDMSPVEAFIAAHKEVEVSNEESAFGSYVSKQVGSVLENLKKDETAVNATVIDNVNERVARTIEELKCLYEVGQVINSEAELSKVLQLVIKYVLRATGGERGIVLFYYPDRKEGEQLASVLAHDVDKTLSADERSKFSRSIAYSAIKAGTAIVSKDTLQDPRLSSKSVVDFNIRSAICAPLLERGKAMGALYVDAKETMREFSQRDTEFFMALANQSALAIKNARLMTDLRTERLALQHKVRELQALYEVSQSLIMVNDLDTVLAKILDQSIEVIGSERGSIMMFDEDTDELLVKVVRGVKDQGPPEDRIRLKRGEGIAGRVVATGEGVIANLGHADPLFLKRHEREKDIRHLLCVPLKIKNQAIGVINLVNRKLPSEATGGAKGGDVNDSRKIAVGFKEDDLKLLASLASQAAVTIENFRLYHLAVFDGLTNLHVHRYFQGYLQKEFEKAKRYGSELAVLLMDIDHFKNFNDTYGHQIGDLVLQEVARHFKESVRETDLVARYGGEEFAAVLPETNLEGAEVLAERFRKRVEESTLEVKGLKLKITISLGIANVKTSGAASKDELIRFADSAMYQAKNAGRNRYCSYRPPLSSRELAEKIAKRKAAPQPTPTGPPAGGGAPGAE